ncbi:NUDIX hydrolase [Verrucomicrobia bacterium]|nr:NUDIX hydrolase [Verrucomicrobiota bacterium]
MSQADCMTDKSDRTTEIFAAGGVLWREFPDGRRLALVHRHRYDDWSLPKGKSDKGETLDETALREVQEETGCQATLGKFIKVLIYDVGSRQKEVHYWQMAFVSDGGPIDEDEVAEVEWVSATNALRKLTYESERDLLESLFYLNTKRII